MPGKYFTSLRLRPSVVGLVPDGVVPPFAVAGVEVLAVEHVAGLVGGHLEVVVGGRLVGVAVVVLACADQAEAEVAVALVDERELCLVCAAQVGVGVLAVVGDDNLSDEPVGGVQRHALVGSVNLGKQDAAHLPVVGTEERLRAVGAHIELPHADLSAEALVGTEGDASAKGVDLELCLDGVVVSNPVTPRIHAADDESHEQHSNFLSSHFGKDLS